MELSSNLLNPRNSAATNARSRRHIALPELLGRTVLTWVPEETGTSSMNLRRRLSGIARLPFVGMGISSCTPGRRPFRIAQLCLQTPEEVTTFTQKLQHVAKSESASYIDESENTERNLRDTLNTNAGKMTVRSLINVGVERKERIGLTAGNWGLGNGIAIGFSEDSNPTEAHKFADKVIRRLSQQWHAVSNPEESGALPMANCK
jgi:hypothetical protein